MKKLSLLIAVLLFLAFSIGVAARYTLNSSLQWKRPIKTVLHQGEGAKTVIEPVDIVLGEPDESLLQMPKGLPVDYQHSEKMRSGNNQ